MIKLVFILCITSLSFAQNTCDEEALARLKARVECWYSNTEKNCQSLPFFSGSAVGAAMALKGTSSPEYQNLKKYLENLKKTSNLLLKDYRDVVRTFYDLKKKSANPNFSVKISELGFEDFKVFEDELKKAHPKNTFIQKFVAAGDSGIRANDIIQQAVTYANSGLSQKVPLDHFFNTMFSTAQLDSYKSLQAFREISIEKGYPENGEPKWDTPEARAKIQDAMKEHKQAMREDLKALAKGSQSGRATIRTMGVTAGIAGALTPVVDYTRRRSAILECAQQLNIKLSDDEASPLIQAIEMKGLLQKNQHTCDQFVFTGDKLDTLMEPQNLTPELKKYFCSLEARMAEKENAMDGEVDWQQADCKGTYHKSDKPIQVTYQRNNLTEIRTSQGVEFSIRTNSAGEWDYNSLKSLNDPDLNQYLQDKIKHPMSYKSVSSKHMSPRVLCDGRESGKYPKNLCDVSKALRVAGQTKGITAALCNDSNSGLGSKSAIPADGNR